MVALSIVGAASLPMLNVQYTPSDSGRSVTVYFSYPDASAELVESEATSKVEGVLAGISNVTGISSTSKKGSGRVVVKFRKGTDMEAARFEVASAIRNAWSELPSALSYPIISQANNERYSTVVYRIKGNIPPLEIARYVREHVLNAMSSIPGVDKVGVVGDVPYHWVITFDAVTARSSGITAQDIASAIRSYYREDIIGMTRTKNGLMTVRLTEASGHDFGAIPIKNIHGRTIYLRDIAKWRYEESLPSSYYRVNGLNTITLSVQIASTANLVETSSSVRHQMDELQKLFPSEISASLAYDSSEYVRDELNKIYFRTGLCILILLLFVFLINRSWRYMLIIVFTLAVNVLMALAIYAYAGLQIHIYTLAGITVSLGIVIDTSIVMIDHYGHFRDRKAFPSVVSAAATTVGALLMIFLLPEEEKTNLVDFTWVIIINLALSLVISYFFIPSLMEYVPMARTQEGITPHSTIRVSRKRGAVRWRSFYTVYINWGLRHRWVYILLFIIAFGIPLCVLPEPLPEKKKEKASTVAKAVDKLVSWKPYDKNRKSLDKIFSSSFGMFYRTLGRSNFYREPQKKQLIITAGMLEGCTVNQLNDVVKSMENYLAKFDEISVYTTSIVSYDSASIVVEFKPEYENTAFPSMLKAQVTEMAINFGGANWIVRGIDENNFNNNIVIGYKTNSIILRGYNYRQLYAYAEKLIDYMSTFRRVKEPEIWSGSWDGRPDMEYVLDYDFEKMMAAGINPYSYYGVLSSLLYEEEVGTVEHGGDYVDVVLRSSDVDSYDLWHVLNSSVEVEQHKMTLSSVGSIEKKRSGVMVNRKNQSYELAVCFDYIGGYDQARKLSGRAVDYMNDEVLPIGFKAEVPEAGMFNTHKEQYVWLLFLIIAVIYVMLAITFESFRYPLAVIFMIPISFIGLFLIFGVTSFAFDQGGFAAFVMLSGIVVNAGIYLVTTYQGLLKSCQKCTVGAAINIRDRIGVYVKAYAHKIVPITLTVVSTILGLLPFLTDGPEEVFWFDFAVGTIAGMTFSIIGIVFVLPVFCIRRRER